MTLVLEPSEMQMQMQVLGMGLNRSVRVDTYRSRGGMHFPTSDDW